MKRLRTVLLCVILTAALLAGCQPTPEEEIVGQKDLEKLIEKAVTEGDASKGALTEYLNAPETYTASFEGYNGNLTVNSNATVTIPDSNGISAMRVSKHDFTQEEADKMIEVFLRGATLYEVTETLTKEDIEDRLVNYYAMRNDAAALAAAGWSQDELQKSIEFYENMLAQASETKDQIPADTTFHASDTATNPAARVIGGTVTVNGKAAYLYIKNGFLHENDVEAIFINVEQPLGGRYNVCPYTVLGGESSTKVPETFTMTKSDAQSVAANCLPGLAWRI